MRLPSNLGPISRRLRTATFSLTVKLCIEKYRPSHCTRRHMWTK